jgi:2-methylcitrate dehydratase PrpD
MDRTHGVAGELARFSSGLRYEQIPARVLEKARYQLANVIASLHAGLRIEPARAVLRAVRSWNESGVCSVIPTGERMSLHAALTANAALSMALDYDDYLYMGHTGHSAVLASLALVEREQLDTRELLVAQVIANEVGGRVGASSVLGPQNGQAWSFIHAAGASAAAARLLRLDAERTAHAISIAMYQPAFTLWPGFMGPGSKLLTAAGPSVTGVEAAIFAAEGLTGHPRIFEHPRKGFWAAFTFVPLPSMIGGLGRAWVTDTLAYKAYPGCAYIDTILDALFMARADWERARGAPPRPQDVAEISVEASLLSVEMDNLSAEHADPRRLSPVNINFSIGQNVALALIAGRHSAAELEQEFLDRHASTIRELASKTRVLHDWKMSLRVVDAFSRVLGRASPLAQLSARDLVRVFAGYTRQLGGKKKNSLRLRELLSVRPRALARARGKRGGAVDFSEVDFTRFVMAFPARVTLIAQDGARFSARQDVPFGAPGQTRYFETVEDKLRREVRCDADRLLDVILRLEAHGVDELVRSACV